MTFHIGSGLKIYFHDGKEWKELGEASSVCCHPNPYPKERSMASFLFEHAQRKLCEAFIEETKPELRLALVDDKEQVLWTGPVPEVPQQICSAMGYRRLPAGEKLEAGDPVYFNQRTGKVVRASSANSATFTINPTHSIKGAFLTMSNRRNKRRQRRREGMERLAERRRQFPNETKSASVEAVVNEMRTSHGDSNFNWEKLLAFLLKLLDLFT